MKMITVTGINLQFDAQGKTSAQEQAGLMILLINDMLSERFRDSQPQIQLTTESEITVIQPTEKE